MRRRTAALAVLACLVGASCKDTPPPAPPPAPTPPAEPVGMDLTAAVASKSTEVYDVTLVAPEGPAANAPANLTISVQAKGGMHVNAEYPISFRPIRTVNPVKFDKDRFDLLKESKKTPCDGAPKDFCTLSADVPFTVDVAGPRRVEGVLAFSVCDKNRCLIEKATLGMDVVAK